MTKHPRDMNTSKTHLPADRTTLHLRKAHNGPVVAESDNGQLLAAADMDGILRAVAEELSPLLARRVADGGDGCLLTIAVEPYE